MGKCSAEYTTIDMRVRRLSQVRRSQPAATGLMRGSRRLFRHPATLRSSLTFAGIASVSVEVDVKRLLDLGVVDGKLPRQEELGPTSRRPEGRPHQIPWLPRRMTPCGWQVSKIITVPRLRGMRRPNSGKCTSSPLSSLGKDCRRPGHRIVLRHEWYLAPRQAMSATSLRAAPRRGRTCSSNPTPPARSARTRPRASRARGRDIASTSPGSSVRLDAISGPNPRRRAGGSGI